jgi:hypothetical protein
MSISSDLNRACSRGIKAARVGGHEPSVYHLSPVDGVLYTSTCLNKGCKAVLGITSLMGVVGDAAYTICQGDDHFANQFDAPALAEDPFFG